MTQLMIDTHTQVLKWFRRFSNEKVKEGMRQVAKLASGANSLILFETMLKQAKDYENMIEPLTQCLSSCNDMSLDMCAYTIVRSFSDCREQPLAEEANVADWLKNIAQFAATFFKKYCSVDIVGLLTYLLNKMRFDNEYIQMVVLQKVIADMFGWSMHDVDEMNSQQLGALAGGFALRLELMSQASQFKRRGKSSD